MISRSLLALTMVTLGCSSATPAPAPADAADASAAADLAAPSPDTHSTVDATATDGLLASCDDFFDRRPAEATLLGANGKAVLQGLTSAASVVAVESCESAACPYASGTMATRIDLLVAAKGEAWSLYLRPPLPAGVLAPGEGFELTVDATEDQAFVTTVDQTVVLARGGQVVLFAAQLMRFGLPPLPKLETFGILVTETWPTCETNFVSGCRYRPHAVNVSADGHSAVLGDGQTARIGALSVTNGESLQAVDTGGCDTKSRTVLLGYRVP